MPIRSITARERALPSEVNATTWPSPWSPNPWSSAARAASVAYPCPHAARASRHPVSTAGTKGTSKRTTESPVKPMKAPVERTSSAQKPKPSASNPLSRRSISWSLSTRVSGAAKYSMTSGSALRAANGSRSAARQRRSISRSVSRIGPLMEVASVDAAGRAASSEPQLGASAIRQGMSAFSSMW